MAGARVLMLQLGDLSLDLNNPAASGLITSDVDLGYPTVREVTTDLPDQDGEYDETSNFSARVVSITGVAYPAAAGSRQKVLDAMAPFLAPKARPTLIYAFDTDVDERSLVLRTQQWSSPISAGRSSAVQYQWKCPDPIAYGLVTNEIDIAPFTGADTGRTYSRTYPRVYPAGSGGSGQAFITSNGTYETWSLIRIFGPCVNPAVYWLDPLSTDELGIQIVTTGITVDVGDYLEVDTKARTMVLNGDPDANRYSSIDFASTVWGPLSPGSNLLKFVCDSASAPALAQVFFQDAFLQ